MCSPRLGSFCSCTLVAVGRQLTRPSSAAMISPSRACDYARVRLHRLSVGPLQLASSVCGKPAVATGPGVTATIPVALEEGEVRLATDAELRAIMQFLPQERDYPQLADAQRAVMLRRESGKTTRDKGRRQMGTGGETCTQLRCCSFGIQNPLVTLDCIVCQPRQASDGE